MTTVVSDFQVDDLGIENCQYFQGYGVAFTPFSDCCYGIGDNPQEALDDCLEQIASSYDIDVENLEQRVHERYPDFKAVGDKPSVFDELGEDSEDMYYHIGIKWKI